MQRIAQLRGPGGRRRGASSEAEGSRSTEVPSQTSRRYDDEDGDTLDWTQAALGKDGNFDATARRERPGTPHKIPALSYSLTSFVLAGMPQNFIADAQSCGHLGALRPESQIRGAHDSTSLRVNLL